METLTDLRIKLEAKTRECARLERDNELLRDALDSAKRNYTREIMALEDRFRYRSQDYLTVVEFAKLARMTRRSLDRVKGMRPDFPTARVVSGRHLYLKTECVDWINRQTV